MENPLLTGPSPIEFGSMTMAEHAQYLADTIDTTILERYLNTGISDDEAHIRACERLSTEGWGGRRYVYSNRPDGKPWWPVQVIIDPNYVPESP